MATIEVIFLSGLGIFPVFINCTNIISAPKTMQILVIAVDILENNANTMRFAFII